MSQKLVQVNAQLVVSPEEFEQGCTPEAAQPFAEVPGLDWKIWIINRETGEAGGIKLFADEEALAAYQNSALWKAVENHPAWTSFQAKVFEILPVPSSVTRAPVGKTASLTFNQMVQEAVSAVPTIKPADAYRRLQKEPDLLVIQVLDSSFVAQAGMVPGGVNIPLASLTYLADCEVPESWRDPRLADRARPIITTCAAGPVGAIGGKLLHDMGFTNVQILEGGMQAWTEAGLPVEKAG